MKTLLASLATLCVAAVLGWSLSAWAGSIDKAGCSVNGHKLYGKIQLVDAFPDVKVQKVTAFPDTCGKWQFVTAFPDTKVQLVTAFPDVKIQYVTAFPGMN
jgi:hypothetical protein